MRSTMLGCHIVMFMVVRSSFAELFAEINYKFTSQSTSNIAFKPFSLRSSVDRASVHTFYIPRHIQATSSSAKVVLNPSNHAPQIKFAEII